MMELRNEKVLQYLCSNVSELINASFVASTDKKKKKKKKKKTSEKGAAYLIWVMLKTC